MVELADAVGVVGLHLAVLDCVELLPHGGIGLVHLLIGLGAALAHQDHVPLALGDLIELLAQVLLEIGVVDALQHIHALLERQDIEVALPHPALHIGKGDGAHGVGDIVSVRQRLVRAGG